MIAYPLAEYVLNQVLIGFRAVEGINNAEKYFFSGFNDIRIVLKDIAEFARRTDDIVVVDFNKCCEYNHN